MFDDIRRFAADVHTISADFHRWAGQLWWLAALALLVGVLNTGLLIYLIRQVRNLPRPASSNPTAQLLEESTP